MLAGLLIAAITAPALAWEFSMTGEAEFRYRYFARLGSGDLFGSASVAPGGLVDASALGLAGPVANAVLVQGFSAKGADASIGDSRVWLYPEIRINDAIRLRGEYWVTGTNLRGLYDGAGAGAPYPNDNWTVPLAYTGWFIQNDGNLGSRTQAIGMSVGMWEKFWMTAQLPWGIFAIGRRPFAFGLGFSCAHEKDADSESIFLGVPYGPLTFGLYTHSRVAGGDFFVENAAAGQAVNAVTGAVTPVAAVRATGTDKNRLRQDFGPFFTYRNGPVEFGMFQEWVFFNNAHTNLSTLTVNGAAVPAGPAGADDFNNTALPATFLGVGTHFSNGAVPIYGDIAFVIGINYFKYNNGRFFLNAEYDYQWVEARRSGGRPISAYGEAWELEIGGMCGPGKWALAAFRSSGDDRRGGLLNITNSTGNVGGNMVYDKLSRFLMFSGREQAMLPYVWLMGIYGGGNNGFDARGKPDWRDIMAYGARLDYAVAANLNVYGTFFYANRDSNTATAIASFAGGAATRAVPTLAGGAVPNVPDNYLGWEASAGVDWKLLEGLTFTSRLAYWQPGDWFKWAYVDYSNLNTVNVSGLALPVNPNRGIDPLMAFQGSVMVDF
jgi:hypothetical protein